MCFPEELKFGDFLNENLFDRIMETVTYVCFAAEELKMSEEKNFPDEDFRRQKGLFLFSRLPVEWRWNSRIK